MPCVSPPGASLKELEDALNETTDILCFLFKYLKTYHLSVYKELPEDCIEWNVCHEEWDKLRKEL